MTLVGDFRKHFVEYDLQEEAIFDRFNYTLNATVTDMKSQYGPSKPKFIVNTLADIDSVVKSSVYEANEDIIKHYPTCPSLDDDSTAARMEVADVFKFTLAKCQDVAIKTSEQFLVEKKMQLQVNK